MSDKISIIIPVYNRVHLINETLESIQKQTYTNWECIIIDDHSTDGTFELLTKLAKQDPRINVYIKPDNFPKGPSASRNYGFSLSQGEFINWFDSDDLMHAEKLSKDIKALNESDKDFTISQSKFFGKDKLTKKFWNEKKWSNEPINDFILFKIGWGVNSPLWRKSSLIITGLLFDEDLITADDYLFHIQALELKLKPYILNECLVYLREHNNRLNEYKLKSPFKLKVNNLLMRKRKKLNLNDEVIYFLNRQYINQISNLLKNKRFFATVAIFLKSFYRGYKFKTILKVIVITLFGLFYKCFGVGYKYLKLK